MRHAKSVSSSVSAEINLSSSIIFCSVFADFRKSRRTLSEGISRSTPIRTGAFSFVRFATCVACSRLNLCVSNFSGNSAGNPSSCTLVTAIVTPGNFGLCPGSGNSSIRPRNSKISGLPSAFVTSISPRIFDGATVSDRSPMEIRIRG